MVLDATFAESLVMAARLQVPSSGTRSYGLDGVGQHPSDSPGRAHNPKVSSDADAARRNSAHLPRWNYLIDRYYDLLRKVSALSMNGAYATLARIPSSCLRRMVIGHGSAMDSPLRLELCNRKRVEVVSNFGDLAALGLSSQHG